MKKIGLLIICFTANVLLIAGPIQERLKIDLQTTKKELENLMKENLKNLQKDDSVWLFLMAEPMKFQMRIDLLSKMIRCLDQKMKEKTRASDKEEVIMANQCFEALRGQLQNESRGSGADDIVFKIVEYELKRIKNNDLRQGWFWWLPWPERYPISNEEIVEFIRTSKGPFA